jgi:dipeptidyl aminopeptidase/acylaminoacyl peptidase
MGLPMLHTRMYSACLAALLALSAAAPVLAAEGQATPVVTIAAPIPTENFFKKPEFSQLTLSPNGKYLAALRPVEGHKKLVIIDVVNKTSALVAGSPQYDVQGVAWINNDRLRYSVGEEEAGKGEQTGGGLFVIDRDGKNARTITPKARNMEHRPLSYFGPVPELDSTDIIVAGFERNAKQTDLYRLDTSTGRKTLLTFDAPEQANDWVLDHAGVPRVASATIKGKTTVYYRAAARAPWEVLASFGRDDAGAIDPQAFDADNKTMYVVARAPGQDKQGIYKYDFANKRIDPTPVFLHPQVDIEGGVITHRKEGKLLGVRFDADKPGIHWIDPKFRALQASIDEALPGRVNNISGFSTSETGLMLVSSYSDRDPGSYYLYDDNKKNLDFLLAQRPWIDPERMAEYRPVRYKARDGLEIPGFLTLPHGVPAQKLPLVVYVHGGPFVHGESWGWHPDAQFLASRGYAVLQPEFRGSTGYGWQHFRKSWKQWGLAMQDDVTDGVNWLVAQGIVDKNRVCIAGASYGGYAVMMGLAKDPDLYRCGINWVGVTDIDLLYSSTWSDTSGGDWEKYGMPNLIGDPVKDAAQLRATSPLLQVKKITKPVLMAYGGKDRRVPLVHGEKMRDALLDNKVPVEWVVYPEEAHGWNKTVNNVDFWDRIDRFLSKNLAK